ncbi:MAG TPA: glycerol-3-phosphate 1-O-acyltransferase PlsY [Anaeromyxobacteraceae bacterium]|nr:glycerol-3-phosphate 1-O-acyltransferase PlsY [Anaeromyxobacteraceae bacterium]
MSPVLLGSLLVALGFLAGSIPFGFVVARLFLGVDVRQVGSGNIGATNVARAGGRGVGVVVLLLDVAKAVLPMLAARALLRGEASAEIFVILVGLAAFLGHLFTPWLGFRGGKGVATALGVFLVLSPLAALAGLAAFAVAYGATRISSVGSLSGTAACAAVAFFAAGPSSPTAWAGLALAALIFLRHRENVGRILRGEEKKMRV